MRSAQAAQRCMQAWDVCTAARQQLCFFVEYVSLSVDMVLHDERCYAGLCATKTLQLVNGDVLCGLKGVSSTLAVRVSAWGTDAGEALIYSTCIYNAFTMQIKGLLQGC
jgi:hypothetical protein